MNTDVMFENIIDEIRTEIGYIDEKLHIYGYVSPEGLILSQSKAAYLGALGLMFKPSEVIGYDREV